MKIPHPSPSDVSAFQHFLLLWNIKELQKVLSELISKVLLIVTNQRGRKYILINVDCHISALGVGLIHHLCAHNMGPPHPPAVQMDLPSLSLLT